MKTTIAITISLLGVALTAPVLHAQCCPKNPPDAQMNHGKATQEAGTQEAVPMLESYAAVSAALYKDDLNSAKIAAAKLTKQGGESSMASVAQELSISNSLDAARKYFQSLTRAAAPLAKGNADWKTFHCPMAFGGSGADWLQKSSVGETRNPYMGAKMPHCGRPS